MSKILCLRYLFFEENIVFLEMFLDINYVWGGES